jgi:hypothetical protein
MKIELFHLEPYSSEPGTPRAPVLVATLETPDEMSVHKIVPTLDQIYRSTQNVHTGWVGARGQFGLRIEPTQAMIDRGGCRSTSIGDYCLVHVGEGFLRFDVARVGWKPVRCDDLAANDD